MNLYKDKFTHRHKDKQELGEEIMSYIVVIVQLALGIVFIGAGLIKCNPKKTGEDFERFGFPKWFKYVSGIIEIVSGGLVLYGIIYPAAAAWGGGLIAITMLGAIYSQVKAEDSFRKILVPLVTLGLSLLLLILNWQYLLSF